MHGVFQNDQHKKRVVRTMDKILMILLDGKKHSVDGICDRLCFPLSASPSIQANIRNLRKVENGGHRIEGFYGVGECSNIYFYQLLPKVEKGENMKLFADQPVLRNFDE